MIYHSLNNRTIKDDIKDKIKANFKYILSCQDNFMDNLFPNGRTDEGEWYRGTEEQWYRPTEVQMYRKINKLMY